MYPQVYLGGPIQGLSYTEAVDWRRYVRDALAGKRISVRDPTRDHESFQLVTTIDNHWPQGNPFLTPVGVATRDRADVMASDLVLMNLLPVEDHPEIVPAGSLIEIGWCDILRKPLIVVMTPKNPFFGRALLEQAAGWVVPTLEDAVEVTWKVVG